MKDRTYRVNSFILPWWCTSCWPQSIQTESLEKKSRQFKNGRALNIATVKNCSVLFFRNFKHGNSEYICHFLNLFTIFNMVNVNYVNRNKSHGRWEPHKACWVGKVQRDWLKDPLFTVVWYLLRIINIEYAQPCALKKMKTFTKAAENVVEVIKIIIAFLQHCFVAICDINLSVRVCHGAGAEKRLM